MIGLEVNSGCDVTGSVGAGIAGWSGSTDGACGTGAGAGVGAGVGVGTVTVGGGAAAATGVVDFAPLVGAGAAGAGAAGAGVAGARVSPEPVSPERGSRGLGVAAGGVAGVGVAGAGRLRVGLAGAAWPTLTGRGRGDSTRSSVDAARGRSSCWAGDSTNGPPAGSGAACTIPGPPGPGKAELRAEIRGAAEQMRERGGPHHRTGEEDRCEKAFDTTHVRPQTCRQHHSIEVSARAARAGSIGDVMRAALGSFKFKLVVYFVLLSLLPIAAAFWGFSYVAGQTETRRVDARVQAGLRSALAAYQGRLDDAQASAQQLAHNRPFQIELEKGDVPGPEDDAARRTRDLRRRRRRRVPHRQASDPRRAAPGSGLHPRRHGRHGRRVRPDRHDARRLAAGPLGPRAHRRPRRVAGIAHRGRLAGRERRRRPRSRPHEDDPRLR